MRGGEDGNAGTGRRRRRGTELSRSVQRTRSESEASSRSLSALLARCALSRRKPHTVVMEDETQYVCMHMCTHTSISIMHMCIHTYICTYVYCACMHVRGCMNAMVYVCTCIRTYVCMYVMMYVTCKYTANTIRIACLENYN
jgi:hypothetical protein